MSRASGTRVRNGWRRWAFPLIALALPVFALAGLELTLRASGAGWPTNFFLANGDRFESNPRYGWRFFPVPLARTPLVASFRAEKGADSYRVFVFGESAAMGVPEPAFGFSRFLEVLLEARHPGVDVEMINTAMTAINSHVVREIARECARYQPDLFVVYMGNNEVVGPFGPATIFTRVAPPLPLIRARLAVQRTRTGQLVERGLRRVASPPVAARWRGMEMLTERRIPASDLRLARTYAHFRKNLEAILDAARGAHVPALVATVPTNLRDNPPFGSTHGRDDESAEKQYRLGLAALAAGREREAQRHLARARDLDVLRFRADERINDIIRDTARDRARDGVLLVDAEREFERVSGGPPGEDLFWEHVHLNPAGSEALARAFAAPAERWLAERLGRSAGDDLTSHECAERLALTAWDRARMASAIFEMIKRPPFTGQLDYEALVGRRRQQVNAARAAARDRLEEAERTYRAAIARRGDDLLLRIGLATLLRERGRFADAAAQWRTALQYMPGVAEWRSQLAFALIDEARSQSGRESDKIAEGEAILRDVVAEQPELPTAHVNLGGALERSGRADAAAEAYRTALGLDPAHEGARFNLAALAAARGDLDEAARLYREAIQIDPHSPEALARLAAVLERQGRPNEAAAAYRRALDLDPDLTWARNNLAYLLERQGRAAEAIHHYRLALAADPTYTLARLNLADLLTRQGKPAEAAEQFRSVLEQEPEHPGALIGLASILAETGGGDGVAEAVRLAERAIEAARARGDARLASALEERVQQLRRVSR